MVSLCYDGVDFAPGISFDNLEKIPVALNSPAGVAIVPTVNELQIWFSEEVNVFLVLSCSEH